MGCISMTGAAGTRRSAPATTPCKARRTSGTWARESPKSASVVATTVPLPSNRRIAAALAKRASRTTPVRRLPIFCARGDAVSPARAPGKGGTMAVWLKSNGGASGAAAGTKGALGAAGGVASTSDARKLLASSVATTVSSACVCRNSVSSCKRST